MLAAIYCRVSVDDRAVSLDAQESGARAWCAAHGHTAARVYSDEGISGAEWRNRPGIAALRADAETQAWSLVVVRDLDRLGRDAIRLPELLSHLRDHGVTVVEWSTGQTVALDGIALLVAQIRAGLAQIEREQIAHRTRTALQQRAERGLVTGGRVYGYRNVRSPDGVRYEVLDAEADVVREIYQRHADGESCRALAHALNARGIPAPRAAGRGEAAWSPGAVHVILRSERYRGEATWGRVGSAYRGGSRVTTSRADVVRYVVPRIVDDSLWTRAQARSDVARAVAGRTAPLSRGPRYLLVGHAVCDACGGPIGSWRTTSGSGPMAAGGRRVVQTYRCSWAQDRGPAVCAVRTARPQAPIDAGVVDALAGALRPDEVKAALARLREQQRPETADARRSELAAIERDATRRVSRLVAAVEAGAGDVAELAAALRNARAEGDAARAALARLDAPRAVDLTTEREMLALAADLRGTLRTALEALHAGDAEATRSLRGLVGAVLPKPLRATVDGGKMVLRGVLRPGILLGLSEGDGAQDTGAVSDPNGCWTAPVLAVG